ncbi:hypothetical protein JOD97_003757 [Duganella sp. 1411]|uniref:hypothetical protein n=1 Tax=Duganella sp. 1411 TaxID=2806572 RepID=UPI001AE42F52|nr:hypothetical protein [Duganella sp. 1411]MBP1205695.1 hypothetical protein [Duganella sp. 1411]
MRSIEIEEMDFIAGGYDYGSNDDMQTVVITGSQQDVQNAKDEYAFANNFANGVGAFAGTAAGMVVGTACEVLTAGAGTPVCIAVGGITGNYVNGTVADGAKATLLNGR